MRKLLIPALLASLPFGALGCGETPPPPPTEAERAQLPGAPTDGPEVIKSKSKKK